MKARHSETRRNHNWKLTCTFNLITIYTIKCLPVHFSNGLLLNWILFTLTYPPFFSCREFLSRSTNEIYWTELNWITDNRETCWKTDRQISKTNSKTTKVLHEPINWLPDYCNRRWYHKQEVWCWRYLGYLIDEGHWIFAKLLCGTLLMTLY